MTEPVIVVEDLGKAYAASYGKKALLRRLLHGKPDPERLRWVLRHVSFTVQPGESLGLIGVNGAGKSTLLKMLAGTSIPSAGRAEVRGSVSALLELGLGFHPEFTGRQNAYMSGQMTGRSREEMDSVMDDIEAFAEVGDYFDMPVRTYSSGMQVRVAFAVATAFQPDVLIVDEALSVGDAYFQHKSFARIRQFREAGATLLFVSHDPSAVKTLCDRVVLLGEGGVVRDGSPAEVLDYYYSLVSARQDGGLDEAAFADTGARRSGNHRAHILSARVVGERGVTSETMPAFVIGEPVRLIVDYEVREPLEQLTLGIRLRDRTGFDVYGINTRRMGITDLGMHVGVRKRVEFQFDAMTLGTGSYHFNLEMHDDDHHMSGNYDRWDQAVLFEVTHDGGVPFIGVAALKVQVTDRCLDAPALEAAP